MREIHEHTLLEKEIQYQLLATDYKPQLYAYNCAVFSAKERWIKIQSKSLGLSQNINYNCQTLESFIVVRVECNVPEPVIITH